MDKKAMGIVAKILTRITYTTINDLKKYDNNVIPNSEVIM